MQKDIKEQGPFFPVVYAHSIEVCMYSHVHVCALIY